MKVKVSILVGENTIERVRDVDEHELQKIRQMCNELELAGYKATWEVIG